MTAMVLGFLLGLRHALDPDHVAAVTTILTRERSAVRAAQVGMWWGLGHTATILVAGGAVVALRLAVPTRLGLAAELLVAVMLIALGVASVLRSADSAPAPARAPVLVGMVHGLAGSAALALLVLAAVPGRVAGLVYLCVFSIGTVAGMIVLTIAISAPALLAAERTPRAARFMRLAAGVASLAVGIGLAHGIGTEWVGQ